MSRDYDNCTICEREFCVDWDADPSDVCARCHNRISRIATATLLSALTRACEQVDGPARAALEQVAKELSNG